MGATGVLLMLSLGAAVCCGFAQPLEVVVLTDNTFEHQTQASTGQTTGHWCVLFVNSTQADDPWQIAAEDAWHQLAEDEDKTAIIAKVDTVRATKLGKRFNVSSTPSALLFRDRAMYSVDLAVSRSPDADKLVAAVAAFINGGYEQQSSAAVPPEPSLMSVVKEFAALVNVQPSWMLYTGLAALAVGVLLFLAFMIAGIWYAYAPDRPPKPAAAATGASDSKATVAAAGEAGTISAAAASPEEDEAVVVKESGDATAGATRPTRRRA